MRKIVKYTLVINIALKCLEKQILFTLLFFFLLNPQRMFFLLLTSYAVSEAIELFYIVSRGIVCTWHGLIF